MSKQSSSPATSRDPDHLDRLIDERQAAKFLGYSPRALQNWRVRGGGPKFVKVSKRSIRYRRRDLIEWANTKTQKSTSQSIWDRPIFGS